MNSGIFLINKDKGSSSNKTIQKIKKQLFMQNLLRKWQQSTESN